MTKENLQSSIGLKKSGRPSCGIYALHYVTGLSIAEVFTETKDTFHRRNKRWKGATFIGQRLIMLKKFGVKWREIKVPEQTLQSYMRDRGHVRGLFMVRTRGHVQIVHHGKVIDQSGAFDIENFWGRRKKITHVIEIIQRKKS